ncbi:MAG: dirigent protein [Caldilineales bacterium]|nr:dirigent protein [Caldilineales bacterium]MCW5860220.1 dirigent protein [Caldilineales bacterium]
MNRTHLIPLALALSLVALPLSACTPPAATTTLTVVEHADTDAVGDVAPAGDSVGDVLGFANPVFDAANARQIGTDNGYCIRTAVGAAWECAWTLTLTDGQITVAGPFLDAGDSALAITGGTGAYAQARGQMKLHARNDQGTEYDFVYEIVK